MSEGIGAGGDSCDEKYLHPCPRSHAPDAISYTHITKKISKSPVSVFLYSLPTVAISHDSSTLNPYPMSSSRNLNHATIASLTGEGDYASGLVRLAMTRSPQEIASYLKAHGVDMTPRAINHVLKTRGQSRSRKEAQQKRREREAVGHPVDTDTGKNEASPAVAG